MELNKEEKWKKDYKECYFESKEEFLWIYVLGGCGCGSADDIQNEVWEVFEAFAKGTAFELNMYDDKNRSKEVVAHWLDSKDLIEHGSSIQGSWLSENGKELYEILLKPIPDNSIKL